MVSNFIKIAQDPKRINLSKWWLHISIVPSKELPSILPYFESIFVVKNIFVKGAYRGDKNRPGDQHWPKISWPSNYQPDLAILKLEIFLQFGFFKEKMT